MLTFILSADIHVNESMLDLMVFIGEHWETASFFEFALKFQPLGGRFSFSVVAKVI